MFKDDFWRNTHVLYPSHLNVNEEYKIITLFLIINNNDFCISI